MRPSTITVNGRASALSALRSRDFRLYWLGYVGAVTGTQMLWVAQGWLLYELTGSKLLLGLSGLAQAIPATVLTFFGGVMADKVDQRRLLIAIQVLRALFLGTLATLCFLQLVQVWEILAVAAGLAAVDSFEQPARQAMFPHLIQRQAMTSAVALNSTVHPGTRMFGPAVTGIVLAQVMAITASPQTGAAVVFAVTALGHVAFAMLLKMVHLPPIRRSQQATVFQDMAAGIRVIWQRRIFAFLIGMTYFNNFFGLSVSVLLPVFAKDIMHVGPSGLGFLYAASGVGSLAGAALAAYLGDPQRRRRLIVGGMAAQGVFLAMFAFSSQYELSLVLLALSGIGSSLFNVAAQSSLQVLIPPEFRGRVMGVWGLTHTSVRPAGEMQAGTLASLASAPFAVAVGGVMVVAFALLVIVPNRHIRELGTDVAGSSGQPAGSHPIIPQEPSAPQPH